MCMSQMSTSKDILRFAVRSHAMAWFAEFLQKRKTAGSLARDKTKFLGLRTQAQPRWSSDNRVTDIAS